MTLPEGVLRVIEPPEGARPTDYGADRLEVQSRSALAHTQWARFGVTAARHFDTPAPSALIHLPRAKDAARAAIAQAAHDVDLLIIDGQKTDGIESILKAVKARAEILGVVSKAHGKTFWFASKGTDFSDWKGAPREVAGGFMTLPGVFSADGPDKGSEALVDALPALSGHVVDLGGGWGFLARHVLTNPEVTHLDLVEEDADALTCARQNLPDPRAAFHWGDATIFKSARLVDHVVMNPPFHKGRNGVPALGMAFIRQAATILAPTGTLWLVANRHLPYEDELGRAFREVEALTGTQSFKVIRAAKPHRQKR